MRPVPLLALAMVAGAIACTDEEIVYVERPPFNEPVDPAAGFLAMGAAVEQVYADLKARKPASAPLYDFKRFSALMGFDWVAEFERKYRDAG